MCSELCKDFYVVYQLEMVAGEVESSCQLVNKPRLLRVEIGDLAAKREILRNATKLRASSKWSNVYVSPDLTLKEREQSKQLREELRARKASGEKDLYIKFGRIVPRPPRLVGGTQK